MPIFRVDGFTTPVFLRRSYLVSKSTTTGTEDGEPPATSNALESFMFPLVSAMPLRELRLASTSTRPLSPAEGSRNPVEARFRPVTCNLALSGVRAALLESTGPISPLNLNFPPPGRSTETVSGNFALIETCDASTFTWS